MSEQVQGLSHFSIEGAPGFRFKGIDLSSVMVELAEMRKRKNWVLGSNSKSAQPTAFPVKIIPLISSSVSIPFII